MTFVQNSCTTRGDEKSEGTSRYTMNRCTRTRDNSFSRIRQIAREAASSLSESVSWEIREPTVCPSRRRAEFSYESL